MLHRGSEHFRAVVVLVCFLLPVQDVFAWGPEGHRIIGEIAQRHLRPEVARKIQDDFNVKYLANVSNWADQVKDLRQQRKRHFSNIETSARYYDRKRDCPDNDCVTEAIPFYEGILADESAAKTERLEALKYLIHFVGDVHQPLHLGNEQDKGGNHIHLNFAGRQTSLHALWDSGLILYQQQTSLVQYARMLDRRISDAEALRWVQTGPVDWTNESRQLALDAAYVLPSSTERLNDYVVKSRDIMDKQLCRAGIRLAHLLNRSLG